MRDSLEIVILPNCLLKLEVCLFTKKERQKLNQTDRQTDRQT